jgi:hypothetical protein
MKNLNTYVIEGLADWSDDKLGKRMDELTSDEAIKQEIIDWLKNNTLSNIVKSRLKFDFNTTPITVDYDGDIHFKKHITSLTNKIFQWGVVGGNFNCSRCPSLKSLEGAPKEVGRSFNTDYCKLLKSLEGAPDKVGEWFNCSNCPSLKTLEGAPKEVGRDFWCDKCGTQFAEDDVKQICKVKRKIYC